MRSNTLFYILSWLSLVHVSTASVGNVEPADMPIELRGIFEFDGTWAFSLIDQKTGQVRWTPLGGNFAGGQVVEFDSVNKELKFIYGLEEFSLKINSAAYSISSPVDAIILQDSAELDKKVENEKLLPFSSVPAGTKGLPALALVKLLRENGYEVPSELKASAEAERGLEQAGRSKSLRDVHDLETKRNRARFPRLPRKENALSREEKIKLKRFGY